MRPRAALIRALVLSVALVALLCPAAYTQTATPSDMADPPTNAAAPPAVLSFTGYQGRTVHDIQFRGVQGDERVIEHLRELLAQKANEPLDSHKVRSSILQLYATGRFADLQVEAEQRPDRQLSLVFIAQENLFIGQMTVDGAPKRPTSTQLIDASKLRLGELFTPEKLQVALDQMKAVLADNGYYQAQVTVDQIRHAETQQMGLHFRVVLGVHATVGEVIVKGAPGYSPRQVEDIAHLHPGDEVSSARVTSALQRLRKDYQKQHRLEAQIAIVNRVYHAESNRVDYVFDIQRGSIVDIRVQDAGVSYSRLKKLVPVFEENAVDDDLLNEGSRNLRSFLAREGYFDAEVSLQQHREADKDRLNIVYLVNRGARHKLTDVRFDIQPTAGRTHPYFEIDDLRDRMQVQPAGIMLKHGRFAPDLLAADVQSMENLYHDNGFQQVKVSGEVRDDYRGDKNRMAVFIHIAEGPQTLVTAVNITGNNTFSADQITALINTAAGQPYSATTVAQDRDSVLNYYFNNGFPDVQLDVAAKPASGDPSRMDVTYYIREGQQVLVDRVLVSGLENTHNWVVDRDIQVHRGEPLSQDRLYSTQAGFYDLGIFNEVNMAVQNPEGRSKYKDVLFDFQEAKRWTFNYGFGIEIQTATAPESTSSNTGGTQTSNTPEPGKSTEVSPRVSFDLTRINFRGRNHTITLHSNLGRLQQRGLISYDAPRWFNINNLRLTFTVLYDNSLNVKTFTSQRFEGSVQALQTVTRRADGRTPITSLVWSLTFRRVQATNLQISQEQIPLLSQPVRVGMPGLTYIRDKRDDPLDAHKGNYNTFDGGYAASALGSGVCVPPASAEEHTTCFNSSFGRMLIQNATYQPFGKKNGFVFARSTRMGIEEKTGSTQEIPLPERFYAGGGSTLRGFGLNQAGPRDPTTGFPIGGGAMFVNNFEMRFPPVTLPLVQDNLSVVLFHDFGNVFETPVDMFNSFGQWTQPDNSSCQKGASCSFKYMSHAVGTGFRYRTPIGPVRVDIGYNLNPPAFFVVENQAQQLQRLGHFNFFFSIGQSF